MTTFGWIQFSDLHLGGKNTELVWTNVRHLLYEDIMHVADQIGSVNLVLFSGDMVLSGTEAQFLEFEKEIVALSDKLSEAGHNPCFVFVPGNHDLTRNKNSDNPASVIFQKMWRDNSVQREFWGTKSNIYFKEIKRAFKNYLAWHSTSKVKKPDLQFGLLPGDFSATVESEEFRVGIVGLNSTYLQMRKGDYKGSLSIDARQVAAVCNGDIHEWASSHDVAIFVTHHPPAWLDKKAIQDLESEIHAPPSRFTLHLFGHEHDAQISETSLGGGGVRRRLQAKSLFSEEPSQGTTMPERLHGYNAGAFTVQNDQILLTLYPRSATKTQDGSWSLGPDASFTIVKGGESVEPIIVKKKPQ